MQQPAPNPALRGLDPLVGEWAIGRGRVSFEWLEGGAFLVQHSEVPHTDFPSATAIIGRDDSEETYCMLYFDSRGVSRVYEMSLDDGVWTIWRASPGFSQRFTGRFSADGKTIHGRWEKSSDASHWEHDFDLTYTKVQ